MRTNVPRVRLIVLLFLFAFYSFKGNSQSVSTNDGKFEIGLGLGPMFFVGDLGGAAGVGKTFIKDLDLPLTKFCKGLYVSYSPVNFIAFRLGANLGYLEGDDLEAPAKGGYEMQRRERSLNFKTKISEAYLAMEIFPTVFLEQYDGLKGKFRPYLIAGVGVFHFDPEAKDIGGGWVKTRPLRLEGQGFDEYPAVHEYSLTQKNLLVGFGFKHYLTERFYAGIEVLHRKTYTDYIDDVSEGYYVDPIYFDKYLSPENAIVARRLFYRANYSFPTSRPYEEYAERGDPKEKDAFFSGILGLGLRLGKLDNSNKYLKCPTFY